jgi:hypothetical protein
MMDAMTECEEAGTLSAVEARIGYAGPQQRALIERDVLRPTTKRLPQGGDPGCCEGRVTSRNDQWWE